MFLRSMIPPYFVRLKSLSSGLRWAGFSSSQGDLRQPLRLSLSRKQNPVDHPRTVHPTFGPVDPVSNIRRLQFASGGARTSLQQKYYYFYQDTWDWLDAYWTSHNKLYAEEKAKFLGINDENGSVSEFNRRFLIENQPLQLRFNLQWYRRIAYITYLGILVELQCIFTRLWTTLTGKKHH
ncbi:hypothetical protein T265_14843 [Opisthorchis viverrini]|uniref:Uncharacterized protein n=1 Tax=Opisthorchis viverrini TaxID=6198 RepID=A0A074ZGX2_OPIVI|nr:hypothetical protein T265_14843 [Opisthorchis viverrini]KER22490.1 hypothetical protein T265_14843 [Opisthorchis viverrini]